MSEFLIYKKFQNMDQASETLEVLKENNILFEIEDQSRNISEFFLGQDMENNIVVRISSGDFVKANEVLNNYAAEVVEEIDPDYYLFKFENAELLEVVSQPDQWSELDVQLAKKIMNDRGLKITNELEITLQKRRMSELTTREKGNSMWMIIGYISSFFGGLLGIGIGLNLWTAKRTLPDGTRVYIYTENDRKHGRIITLMGTFIFLIEMFIINWFELYNLLNWNEI